MDPPDHPKLRGLVATAFTPKQVRRISDQVTVAAKEVVDGFAGDPSGHIELVSRLRQAAAAADVLSDVRHPGAPARPDRRRLDCATVDVLLQHGERYLKPMREL